MKLTIELVPRNSYFKNIRSIVSEKRWDEIRKKAYKKANHQCEICGNKGRMECHETWSYENGIQKLTGLITLCSACHEVKHYGLAEIKGNAKRAYEHLKKINELSEEEAYNCVEEAFNTWRERNKVRWTLDIFYLEKEC
jgi:5-methylcytosine-specific restriction endonuclease McrA